MASLEALKWLIRVPDGALAHTHTQKLTEQGFNRIVLVFL